MICSDAKPLLKLYRHLTVSKEFSPKVQRSLIDAINLIRWSHDPFDDECCQCWINARREAGKPVAA